MGTIGEPKPVPPPVPVVRPVWGKVADLREGEGIFVTGFQRKAVNRMQDRMRKQGILVSVHKDVEDGVEGFMIRRKAA